MTPKGSGTQFDHVALACPDLDAALARLESELGVTFQPGGTFANDDSRNAIAGVSNTAYVGLIGPIPNPRPHKQGSELAALAGIQPYSLVYASRDLLGVQRALATRKVRSFIEYRERTDRKGEVVRLHRLRIVDASGAFASRNVPIFLDWLDSTVPAATVPSVVERVQIEVRDPDPDWIAGIFDAADVDDRPMVFENSSPGLTIMLTASGRRFETTSVYPQEAKLS